VVVAGAAGFAWTHPGSWFVAQAHLHNLVPAVFLWEWSGRVPPGPRRRSFRVVTLVWVLAVPLMFVAGVFDPFLAGTDATVAEVARAADESRAIGGVVPDSAEGGELASRLLAAFAFAQLLHYYVWCVHFPRRDPDATARFEHTAVGSALRGWRVWLAIGAVTAVVVAVAAMEYRQGRTLYTSLAAYHAYLEFPILVALVIGWGSLTRPRPLEVTS
jgi:hypothetical protein